MREEDSSKTAPTTSADLPEDENLWLEDIYGEK